MAIFLAYPETGQFGGYYLAISIVLWSGFMMFINLSVKIVKFISGILGHVLNAAIFVVMVLAISITMPQANRITVFEKIKAGDYPTKESLQFGLSKLGLTKKNIPKIPTEKIKNKVADTLRDTLDKIEENSPMEEND